jgi:iron(III) transport system substrate-binding protein
MIREGLLARYVAVEDAQVPAKLKIGAEWRSLGNRLFHIMYNTKLVAEKDAPKSWDDLLDPKWKGKLILDDASYDWFVGLLDYMGEAKGLEYMKRLARNGLQIQQRRSNVENMVSAGEVPIMVCNSGTSTADRAAQGEPVAFVKDPKPPIAYGEGLSIMRNATHPHAAALFIEGLLSEKWQRKAAEKIKIRAARPEIPDPLLDPKIQPHFIDPAKWPAERYEWAQREYTRILVRKES